MALQTRSATSGEASGLGSTLKPTEQGTSVRHKPSWSNPFSKLFGGAKSIPAAHQDFSIGAKDTVIAILGRVNDEVKRQFIEDALLNTGGRQDYRTASQVHHTIVRHPEKPEEKPEVSRSVVLVYPVAQKEQKLTDSLRVISNWLSEYCTEPRKLSGLIYLEDSSTASLPKLSRHAVELLDKSLEGPNIVLATTGWDDTKSSKVLEIRHKELRVQWKSFVDRGASVIRLAAPRGASKEVSHKSEDILKLVVAKAEEKKFVVKRSQWKGKDGKDDQFLEDARSTDVVIPIMGPTGAGKSTFVNAVAGKTVTTVGHSLTSETARLQPIVIPHPSNPARRIIIVDTPGFDDTYVADSEILKRIATWLAKSYSANMTLAGVIYLHEISQTRMLGTARKNLDMFNKLCGDAATKNVILATTKWSQIKDKEIGDRRESQLKDRHWEGMVQLGAQMRRFSDTQESGWGIIQSILDRALASDVDAVEIQKELVEVQTMLPDTQAGQALRYTLEELLEAQRLAATQLRNDEDSHEVRAMLQETEKKIRATMKEISQLSVPVGHRLREWMKRVPVDDTLALIFGQIGVGKSTFINYAAEKEIMRVGHGLQSETRVPAYHIVSDPNDPSRRYFFVDTPGFNDADVDDQEILARIVGWLKKSPCRMRILVVYLVEANSVSDMAAPLGPLVLSAAMGAGMSTGLRITITNTNEKDTNVDTQERKLRKKIASVHRFRNSRDSAWEIIRENDLPVAELSTLADALDSTLKTAKPKAPPVKTPLFSRLFKGW
ncbi:hypothetical protein DXG01_002903 [Tephrocybe rancida]|nr:hypothetical protein DXG01_002903 [Tephrocybe rancida]